MQRASDIGADNGDKPQEMLDSNREKWKLKSLGQKLTEVLGKEAVLMRDREVTERHKAESKKERGKRKIVGNWWGRLLILPEVG